MKIYETTRNFFLDLDGKNRLIVQFDDVSDEKLYKSRSAHYGGVMEEYGFSVRSGGSISRHIVFSSDQEALQAFKKLSEEKHKKKPV